MVSSSKSRFPQKERRNERERKRVHQVNVGFDRLRDTVARVTAMKKLSKADTLREAARYIAHLRGLLEGFAVPRGDHLPVKMEEDKLDRPRVSPQSFFSPPSSSLSSSSCSSASSSTSSLPPFYSHSEQQQLLQEQQQQQLSFIRHSPPSCFQSEAVCIQHPLPQTRTAR